MSGQFTTQWLLDREARLLAQKRVLQPKADTREIGKDGLQQKIQDWCDAQWPKWVYDFPRTDLRSTLPLGRHDSTVWGPFPKCFVIETKAKGRKRTHEQLIWATRMKALGWDVKVVYSLDEFLEIVTA